MSLEGVAGKRKVFVAAAGLACLFGGVQGCASSDGPYDRLAAQTSQPGWVVGDSLGLKLSTEQRELAAYSQHEPSDSTVASGDSDQ